MAGEQSAMIGSSGISVRLWRLYAQAWLVCLLFPVAYVAQTPLTPIRLSLAVGALAIFAVSYTWVMWPHPLNRAARSQSPASSVLLIALTGLALWLSLAYGSAFLWLFVGLSAIAGVALSPRSAFVVVMGLTLLTLGLGVEVSQGAANTDWLHLLPLVLLVRGLGLDITGMVRLSAALRELHAARGALARQAATEERLRLARDLHDLLGHTLSLITLKAELAGRLVESEPARAAREIQEVEQVARQALSEVREAVAGYRQPTLQGELDGARQILEAAGVICAVPPGPEGLPASLDTTLAWAVREGVTNVIRHSRARHCAIRLSCANGQASVEIINDGPPAVEPGPLRPHKGTGLAGLSERVAAQGGRLETGRLIFDGQPSYRLWAELPLPISPGARGEP